MLLPYGWKDGYLIHISEVQRGKTNLVCPYCEGILLAKKGKKLAHHFAHVGASCQQSYAARFFGLSTSPHLKLSLSDYTIEKLLDASNSFQKLLQRREYLRQKDQYNKKSIRFLVNQLSTYGDADFEAVRKSIIQYCRWAQAPFPTWEQLHHKRFLLYTDGTTVINFEDYQASQHSCFYPQCFHSQVIALQDYHQTLYEIVEVEEKIKYYQADWQWFKQFQLYFLKIEAGAYATFYKIGLTSRQMPVRLKEIQTDLNTIFQKVEIEVVFLCIGIAFLENFFKQKYQHKRYAIAQFTEYFYFEPFEMDAILKELAWIATYQAQFYVK